MSFAWKGFHSFGGGFSPSFGPSLTGGITPIGSWDASTSTLAQLAALVSHSRTSLATMFDSTGKLTYAPNNLLLNTATLGTQTVTVQVGANYILSIKGTGSVTLTGASTAGPLNGTGAANRVDLKITAATSSLTLTVAGSVTSARLSAVTYEAAFRSQDDVDNTASAYYGPRIDYDPNTLAVKGLLIEEARTNYATYSNNMAGGTLTASGGAIAGGVADLSGGTTGITFTATAGNATHHAIKTGGNSLTAGTKYTATFWLKQGNAAYTVFGEIGDTPYVWGSIKWSDLSVQTNGQDGAIVSTPIAFGGGIYQVSITYTRTVTGASILGFGPNTVSAATIGNAANIFNAAGTETAICVAWQIEAGAFKTSLIPTAASSVARAADVVQFTGAALTALQGSAATFVGQTIGLPFNPAANSALVAATAGNSIIAYVTNSNAVGVAAAATYNGAAALIVGTPNYTTAMRIGSAFSGSGRSLVVNGGSVATDANAIGSRPAVYLGGTGVSLYLNGWMQSFAIYNQRLADGTLQSKSVVGASY